MRIIDNTQAARVQVAMTAHGDNLMDEVHQRYASTRVQRRDSGKYLGLGDLLEELLKAGDIVRDEVVLAVVALALRPLLLLALALGRALRGGGLLLFGLLLLLRRLQDSNGQCKRNETAKRGRTDSESRRAAVASEGRKRRAEHDVLPRVQ